MSAILSSAPIIAALGSSIINSSRRNDDERESSGKKQGLGSEFNGASPRVTGSEDNGGATALIRAAHAGDIETVTQLLGGKSGVDAAETDRQLIVMGEEIQKLMRTMSQIKEGSPADIAIRQFLDAGRDGDLEKAKLAKEVMETLASASPAFKKHTAPPTP